MTSSVVDGVVSMSVLYKDMDVRRKPQFWMVGEEICGRCLRSHIDMVQCV